MQLEITETQAAALPRAAFFNLSWGAIFAGLAVGMASNMLLMMLGTATGLSLFDLGDSAAEQRVPAIAALWNTASMVVAAFIGGYIAARASGLRRSFDGVLHAAVAWGMTLLLSVFMASSVSSATFDVMFPALHNSSVQEGAQVMGSLERGDRQEAAETLQRTLGVSEAQASLLVDQALALSGRSNQASADGRAAAQKTLRTATLVSLWLTASVALSLIAALGGGAAGVRGSRRVLHRRVTHVS